MSDTLNEVIALYASISDTIICNKMYNKCWITQSRQNYNNRLQWSSGKHVWLPCEVPELNPCSRQFLCFSLKPLWYIALGTGSTLTTVPWLT